MAGAGTSTNVDIGPGWLYAAPIGTSEPTDASTALPSAWRCVGYTETGNAFTSNITSSDIEVAEELEPIDVRETKRLTDVQFEMAEVNRQNLALAFNSGANSANTAASYEPPALGASIYVMLAWDLNATADATNVRWVYRKAKQTAAIQIQHRKAPQKALIPVTFRIVKPTGAQPWIVFPSSSGTVGLVA